MRLEDRGEAAPESKPAGEAGLGRVQVDDIGRDGIQDPPQPPNLAEHARPRGPPGEPVDVLRAQPLDLVVQPAVARARDGDLPAAGDLVGHEVGDAAGDACVDGLGNVEDRNFHETRVLSSEG